MTPAGSKSSNSSNCYKLWVTILLSVRKRKRPRMRYPEPSQFKPYGRLASLICETGREACRFANDYLRSPCRAMVAR